jgi:hypothetical protein
MLVDKAPEERRNGWLQRKDDGDRHPHSSYLIKLKSLAETVSKELNC